MLFDILQQNPLACMSSYVPFLGLGKPHTFVHGQNMHLTRHKHNDVPNKRIGMPITQLRTSLESVSPRERESLHLSSHTGLMQVLPGHPLADTVTECSITV